MSDIFSTALSGLNASRLRAQTAANNLANLNTRGYRSQRVDSSTRSGGGVSADHVSISKTPGYFVQTGNPLDVALSGPGYFHVRDNQGGDYYTRDGAFQLNSNGQLVTSQGFSLEPPIVVPTEAQEVSINSEGVVSGTIQGKRKEFGQIEIATFSNPDGLLRQEGSLSEATGASGAPNTGLPGTGGRGVIQSGYLEGSNVDIAHEAIQLLTEEAITKANAAVIRTADEMQQDTLDLLG